MSTAIRYLSRSTKALIMAGAEPAWIAAHPRATYIRAGYLSVPPWIDREEMRWLHWCKCAWTLATGVEHVIDHIIPLNHPHVCGLTVPWNFQLVPRAVNANKLGNWHPDQMALDLECASA